MLFPFFCHPICVAKVITDKATGVLIVPHWPTQVWYPTLCKLMVQPPILLSRKKTAPVSTIRSQQTSLIAWSSRSSGMCHLREAIIQTTQGLSQDAQDLIVSSWRSETIKQYKTHLGKWNVYCTEKHISPYLASVIDGINFLSDCFTRGYSYNALNTARSALSATITLPSSQTDAMAHIHLS